MRRWSIVIALSSCCVPVLAWAAPPVESSPSQRGASGSISGVVRGSANDEPIADALVIVDCACLAEPIEVYTNARGVYRIAGLPPGNYTIEAMRVDAKATRSLALGSGESARLDVKLVLPEDDVDIIVVETPAIDVRRPTVSTKMTGEEMHVGNPTGGNEAVSGVIATAPTAMEGPRGFNVVGNDSTQNRYQLNDHDIGDPNAGNVGASVVQEFVAEGELLESGYEARHGSASGGQVRMRRIAGTNDFTGRAGVRFAPRLAPPRLIMRTDEALRVTSVPDFGGSAYATASGPILRDRLFFSIGVNFTGAQVSLRQSFYHRVDRDDSGGFSGCPYENGTNDCVEGHNHIATKKFADQRFKTGGFELGWVAGIDWRITRSHSLGLTAFGGPNFTRTSYRLPFSIDPVAFGTNPGADPLGGGARIATGIIDDHFGTDLGINNLIGLEYHGRAFQDKLEIDASLSYFQLRSETAWKLDRPEQKLRPAMQETSASGRNLFEYLDEEGRADLVPGLEKACNDADLPGVACPIRTWVSGGLGKYDRDVTRRVRGSLDLTAFFDGAGSHQLGLGGEVAWMQRDSVYRYSGSNADDFADRACEAGESGHGEYCYSEAGGYRFTRSDRVDNHRYILVDGDNPDNRTSFGYGTVRHETGELRALADPLGRGVRAPAYDESLSTLNYAAYLQDRWAILPNLVVTPGVRWEIQDMRDIYGRSRVLIWDNVGPRVGVVYDWTEEGRSRLYASYGWLFQPLPLQLNSRVFGGLVSVSRSYKQSDCVGQAPGSGEARLDDSGVPTEWCVDGGGATSGLTEGAVVPRLRGPYNQQFQLGYEQEIVEDLVLGIRWLHQDLGRAVEDVSTNGGVDFIIANPGEPVRDEHIAAQRAECDRLSEQLDGLDPDNEARPQIARELQRCEFMADAFSRVGTMFPKPVRTLDSWTIQVIKRFAKNWSLRASYTYSRQIGNYDGYVDPVSGAVNLGASTQYDLPELVRNSFGPLQGVVPHMFNLDAIYGIRLGSAGMLTLAGSLRVRSGLPIDVRSDTPIGGYQGQYLIHLLPRGGGGRTPPNYRLNLTVSYAVALTKRLELEVIARIINVTNAQAVLRVDQVYSYEGARPIAGGDVRDLKHARRHEQGGGDGFFDRDIVRPQGNYGVETQFQQPIAGQFELGFRF